MGKKTEKRTETNALVLKLDNGKELKVHLETNHAHNTIDLLATIIDDENVFDPTWYIVSVQSDGTLLKHIDIAEEVGLRLTPEGAIKTSKEAK